MISVLLCNDDLSLHHRVQRAEIVINATPSKRRRESLISIEYRRLSELVLDINDKMGHVIVVDPHDFGARRHCERGWTEFEVVDAYFVGAEDDVLPCRLALDHRFVRCAGERGRQPGKRCVDYGERAATGNERNVGYAEYTLQSVGLDLHRSGRWSSAGRRLGECGRHRGVKGNVSFNFLHDLVDVSVENRHRSKSFDES